MVSPTLIAAAATIIFGIIATLVGLAYRNLRSRVRDLEEKTDTREGKHNGLSDKVDTIWKYLFGVKDDETDAGLSGEISDGFDRVEEDINDLKKKQETYHEAEMERLERLVNELHDDEDVNLEREDIFEK